MTLVVVTLIFIINYKGNLDKFEWVEDPFETLGQLAVKLFVVGALLDQLISVFFPESAEDQSNRRHLEHALKINRTKQRVLRDEMLRDRLTNKENIRVNLMEQMNETEMSVSQAETDMADLNTKRTAYVRRVAFAIGLVLAITGITVLTDFITNIPEDNIEFNDSLIYYLDIILTAALLSGGTSGINQFFRVLRDSWKNNGVN